MSAFTFSSQRVADLRQRTGQICACLALVSDPIECDGTMRKLRGFRRSIRVLDGDNEDTGQRKVETVMDPRPGEEAPVPAKLTVLLVELVDVYAAGKETRLETLDSKIALACGFKTLEGLREDWRVLHPRSPLAKLVWFCLGDQRDRDRYLQRWISHGGDYSTDRYSAIDELPALTEEQLAEVAANAGQRDVRRRAEQERRAEVLTLSERIERLLQAGPRMQRELRHEVRIITTRTDRALKKLT